MGSCLFRSKSPWAVAYTRPAGWRGQPVHQGREPCSTASRARSPRRGRCPGLAHRGPRPPPPAAGRGVAGALLQRGTAILPATPYCYQEHPTATSYYCKPGYQEHPTATSYYCKPGYQEHPTATSPAASLATRSTLLLPVLLQAWLPGAPYCYQSCCKPGYQEHPTATSTAASLAGALWTGG